MKFMLFALTVFLSCYINIAENPIKQASCNETYEYTTSKEVYSLFNVFAFNQKRLGKKKGKIEQIVSKLPNKKKPLIIANDWSQEDYMVISLIIFLSKRLDLAKKTFEVKKYNNWIFGNVPPLEELSSGIANFTPLPEWRSWWEKEGDSKKVLDQIDEIYLSITNAPDTFRFSDESASNKITKPFLSLAYIFSREMIRDNALIKNMSRNNYREEVIKNLETKKEEFNLLFGSENPNYLMEQPLNLEKKKLVKSDHLSLFKRAYNHVLFVKKRRKFNSENGDSNIELLPNWWEKELDIITAIILTIFKYQYRHRLQIIEAENKIKNDFNWKKIHSCIKKVISCTTNGANNSLEHIPIWHRFGEKWQSFPQGAMIRILDNVSKLSLNTKSWDVYDYVICLCFYYVIKREKIRINWFTLGPLSGSPKTRFWRRFKMFVTRMFSSNKGMFDMNNKWLDLPDGLESEQGN